MARPTISLAIIAKNEAENLKRLFDSVEGCVDEIVLVDTGSTDETVKIAKELGAKVYHFDWINDFSAARNFSFSKVTSDYAFWLDCDDILHNKEAFIEFRNHSLQYFDFVFANYHYALDEKGNPIVSFVRERIFKMSTKPVWNYFVHEGVKPPPGIRSHFCANWSVKHLRTSEDMVKDKSRNLNIFESKKQEGKLDGRMTFYYGKEFFENGQPEKAIPLLLDSVKMNIEEHDRILAMQYVCYALVSEAEKLKPEFQAQKFIQVIAFALQGIQLAPNRAEFWCLAGDAFFKLGQLQNALPFYAASINCHGNFAGDAFSGAIHTFKTLYQDYPRNQMAKILFNLQRFEEAKTHALDAALKFKSEEGKKIYEEIVRLEPKIDLNEVKEKTEDIVFTCPPQTAYPFDEELYKSKGMGGSETALIEMAVWLKKITGRKVIVFNMRDSTLVGDSGVEWRSTTELNAYFEKYEPSVHIAWRHNIRLTKAPSYLWCHDLMIQGVEHGFNQDYVMCLTPFHANFLHATQGVPKEKIILTRNGINPDKFKNLTKSVKDPNKFVYASSPDRGLDRCMLILDKVRAKGYDIKLHVFYGLDNLYKYGQGDFADHLKKMMDARPWVKYHGFTEQRTMYEEYQDASMSLLPNNFIETSMLTAVELLACGVYIVIRRWGGVVDTLGPAEKLGMCTMLDIDSEMDEQHEQYANAVIKAIEEKAWERVSLDPETLSWKDVAKQWINMFDLKRNSPSQSQALRESPGLDI